MSTNKFNNKIEKNIMSGEEPILKGIDKIKSLKRKIILITKKNKLIGTVTDGDLRKSFFLKNNNFKLRIL